jgi:predicted RND superfamily exporter protein
MLKKEDQLNKTVEELTEIYLKNQEEFIKVQSEASLTVKVNTDLAKKVEQLEKRLKEVPKAEASKSRVSDKTFKIGEDVYGFRKAGINHKNQVITAAEVLASENLQNELVEIGSGMIYKK